MDYPFPRNYFPSQRVSYEERQQAEWYANCCDGVIALGQSIRDSQEDGDVDELFDILHGNIPEEYYRKALNPYNATKDKYKRFPATMRNYDMMNGVIRRFVGEYLKAPHDFVVGANNPEVVLAKDAKLNQELMGLAEEAIAGEIERAYQQFINEGNEPEQFNPSTAINIEEFVKKFNEDYIDDITIQGQRLLNVIRDLTDDLALYIRAYFEFVSFGRAYTYTEIAGNKLIKRVVSVRDAYPVPNDNLLVEDYDMFAERRKLSYQQIMDEFADYLDKDQIEFLNIFYARDTVGTVGERALLNFDKYYSYNKDVCGKFTADERKKYQDDRPMARDMNNGLYDVWHVVWRGEVKRGILKTQVNGFIIETIVDEKYVLNPEIGDISIEWVWEPQVYESVRIGTRNTAIYPYKYRPIAYNRNGKLPYNGLMELIPGYGRFSIISTLLPYQVFGNIVAYHREMAIAKNKLNVLLIARSLLGKYPEDTIYKMAADGVLYIDDTNDAGMLRAGQIRMLNADTRDYITQLTNLITANEQKAMYQVDMTPQRYGEIATSAGKGTTEEAIARGSMGSVIVEFMFDIMREHDYNRDIDYSKLAWIDGLNTSYRDDNNQIRYMSLDVNTHILADYVVKCKLSGREKEKLEQYRELAFSAAQNGDMRMAAAAIEGENSAEIKKQLDELAELNQEHEEQMKQLDAQNAQMLQQYELDKIAAKGEQDRQTLELEKYLDSEIEMIKANANIMSFDNGLSDATKAAAEQRMQEASNNLEQQKIGMERERMYLEAQAKDKEIAAKMYDSDIKLKVAKENKNRFDKLKTKK